MLRQPSSSRTVGVQENIALNILVILASKGRTITDSPRKIHPTGDQIAIPVFLHQQICGEHHKKKPTHLFTTQIAQHMQKHKNTKQAYQLLGKTSVTILLSFLNNDAALLSAARPSDTRPKSSMKPASAADIPLATCPVLAPHVWRFSGLSVSEPDMGVDGGGGTETRTSPFWSTSTTAPWPPLFALSLAVQRRSRAGHLRPRRRYRYLPSPSL